MTPSELALNNGRDGRPLHVQINSQVYDLTSFAKLHPGGQAILETHAGTDCTELFNLFHNPTVLPKYHPRLPLVGTVSGAHPSPNLEPARSKLLDPNRFGDQVPYGDPFWYQRSSESPYYKATHHAFRARVRAFVDSELLPTLEDWAGKSSPPPALMQRLGAEGFLACMAGGPPYPSTYVSAPAPEDFDYFHVYILFDELARCGNAGALAALTNGAGIACSAILRYGSAELKQRVLPDVLAGRKVGSRGVSKLTLHQMIALGVSEPNAGSDVSGLSTRMVDKGPGVLEIHGTKKWITNGTYADYITLLARDKDGFSLVVVPTDSPGFSTRKVLIRDSDVSGTALLDLCHVQVPLANVVGQRGAGWKMQMSAFNFERMYVATLMIRLSRVCLEECIKYAIKRRTFGVPIHQHQAIRMRVAEMIRDVEGVQAWAESVIFQQNALSYERAQVVLGDVIGLLKVQASLVYERCARHTLHVFGGNGAMMKGPGWKIEQALLQTKGYLIPAGSVDILDDFGARQAFKLATQVSKL